MSNQNSESRLFYLNSLFDLELGGFDRGHLAKAAAEMTPLVIPLARKSDYVLLDCGISDEYLEYLEDSGLDIPGIIRNGRVENCIGEAWGWSRDSVNRLEQAGAECDYPSLDVVRKINSREFAANLSLEHGLGVPGSFYCDSKKSVGEALRVLSGKYPLVIKPAFGGAGHGFRIIRSESDLQSVDIGETGLYKSVIEPWRDRKYDLSTVVEIDKSGAVTKMRHQRLYCNSHGAFYGAYLAPSDSLLNKWTGSLEKAAGLAVSALAAEGYFGTAGFDAFVYADGNNEERPAPVIEINGRHVCSDIAHALRMRLSPGNRCYYRLISKRHMRIPGDYKELSLLLGENGFDPRSGRGIVCLSPLKIVFDNHSYHPSRYAFFIAAETENELFKMDDFLRERLSGRG